MLCFLVHICVPCLLWFRLPALRLIGLKRVLNVFTLYSWMTPFCISLGGGSQETLTPEELLSFTVAAVTALGGALGTVKRREAINILIHANCEWNTQCTRKMQCCEQICYVKKSDKISRVFFLFVFSPSSVVRTSNVRLSLPWNSSKYGRILISYSVPLNKLLRTVLRSDGELMSCRSQDPPLGR